MAEERNNGGGGRTAATAGIIALLLLLGGGGYFGLGPGQGMLPGNGDSVQQEQSVEEYNSDSRTFTLEEEESILDTYNWVKAVFDELDIQLKNSR